MAWKNGGVQVQSVRRVAGVLAGGSFSDPTNERIIYLSAAGLALLGALLLFGTIRWWRRGRQEHPVLAPLEVMGQRAWAKAPETDRLRRLEQVRASAGGAVVEAPVRAEPVDLEAAVRNAPQAFDDLRDPQADDLAEVSADGVVGAAEAVEQPDAATEIEPAAESGPAAADAASESATPGPYDEFADLLDTAPLTDDESLTIDSSDASGLKAMVSSPKNPQLS